MAARYFLLCVVTLLAAAGAVASAQDSLIDAADRFEKIANDNSRLTINAVREILDPEYAHRIEPHAPSLPSLSDEEIRAYMSAARIAALYTKRPEYLLPQQAGYRILESRSVLTNADLRSQLSAYIMARDFEQAAAFARHHQALELEFIPPVADHAPGTSYNALVLGPDQVLEPVELDLSSGNHLVAMVHPHCGFSRQAMKDLAPRVVELPTGGVIWVTPFDGSLAAASLHRWQQENEGVQFVIPTRFEAWSFLQRSEVPLFIRIHDGVVMGEVSGWPPAGNLEAIQAMFEP